MRAMARRVDDSEGISKVASHYNFRSHADSCDWSGVGEIASRRVIKPMWYFGTLIHQQWDYFGTYPNPKQANRFTFNTGITEC
jgi:hypothetical protein